MIRRLLVIYLILFLGACVSAEQQELEEYNDELGVAYEMGQPILLFYVTAPKDSEAYFDWHSYFSDFKQTWGKDFFIQRVEPGLMLHRFTNANMKGDYSLFIKKGGDAYLYSGLILEPQVYLAVVNAYQGKAPTDVDRAFLPQQIHLKK